MKIVDSLALAELKEMSQAMYGELVKAVVDVEEKLVVVDAELHVDEEQLLLEQGSKQHNLWGINLYPEDYGTDDFIEFDSMINVRPANDNRSRSVENEGIQQAIREIIAEVVHE